MGAVFISSNAKEEEGETDNVQNSPCFDYFDFIALLDRPQQDLQFGITSATRVPPPVFFSIFSQPTA
jgi:hypothetical protein